MTVSVLSGQHAPSVCFPVLRGAMHRLPSLSGGASFFAPSKDHRRLLREDFLVSTALHSRLVLFELP